MRGALNSTGGRGALASVASSVFFGGVYFVTPMLAPASAEAIWGIRNLVAIPMIALALISLRQWRFAAEIGTRIKRNPLLILPILVCGTIIMGQLWVFSWAPMHGRGLNVALGYFLLPLVLVVVGRFLYRDQLTWWHWTAAGIAAAGVAFQIVRVGGISWETLLVGFGYPVYFVLRRAMGMAHLGGMFWEFLLLSPLALFFLVRELVDGSTLAANPALVWSAPLFALWTGVALMLYVVASRMLPISIFGLLSYLEPALLVVASILIGESIQRGEYVLYGAIWIAVLIVVIGGLAQLRQRPNPS
ncbi:EamA family transporter RarD [Leucobacter sp. CSA2]|uniref:EamA family transporter RarD n=1 Tax=Leucobacter edaphi TaxID=2796472 RepID=A0A934UYK8_9MICO|nr:EamA family transporter RarD [Leucobacter edaphi]